MIPAKIKTYLRTLNEETKAGSLKWIYFDTKDEYHLNHNDFDLTILYMFDQDREQGLFRVQILDKKKGKEYSWVTLDDEDDYDYIRCITEEIQASDFDLDLGISM